MHKIIKIGILSFCIGISSVLAAGSASTVHEYTLDNGLKLIVKEDHRAPVVVSMVWYKVGSAYELPGLTGISHMLEHMMYKGTPRHGPGEFSRLIAENGGQEDAFTDNDYTAYYQEVAVDRLPLVFDLEADRMHNLTLTNKEFMPEHNVVTEERYMRVDDSPQSLTYERFLAAAHVNNPYHHMPIGWLNDIKNYTVEQVQNWYKTWYGPNNATLIVVGDVQPEAVYHLAKKYFGPLKPITLPRLMPREEPPALGERNVVVRAPAKLPWIIMGYNVPVIKTATEKWEPYALDVLEGLLDAGDSSRLQQNLVRGQQVASGADAGYSPFSLFSEVFVLLGTPAPGHTIPQLQAAFLDQIKQLQDQPVSQQELDRIKTQIIAQHTFDKDSMMQQATQIGGLESVGLPWQTSDHYFEEIQKITPQQIQAVARKYLTRDRLTVAVLHPLPIDAKAAAAAARMSLGVHNVR